MRKLAFVLGLLVAAPAAAEELKGRLVGVILDTRQALLWGETDGKEGLGGGGGWGGRGKGGKGGGGRTGRARAGGAAPPGGGTEAPPKKEPRHDRHRDGRGENHECGAADRARGLGRRDDGCHAAGSGYRST